MEQLMAVLREIDEQYAAPVAMCEPVGTQALPLEVLGRFHRAFERVQSAPPELPYWPGISRWVSDFYRGNRA